MQSTEDEKPKFFYGYIIVVAAFFILAVMQGTFFSFGVFFKPVLVEFGWTRAMTAGAFSLCIVLHGVLSILSGRLNDRFGPRLVITGCGLLLGLGYLLMSQISTIWQLYLFYGVIIGIAMSGAWIPAVSTVARWFVKRRGLVTGIVLAGIGLGNMIISPLASRLILIYNWQTAYIIVGIIVLVLVVLAAQFLRRDPSRMGQLPYGASKVSEQGLDWQAKGYSLQEAIHTRQFWLFCAIFFCAGFCIFTITVHIVPHATELGISAITAANILAVIGAASIVGRLAMGSAGDRIGNRPSILICFILMSAALVWLLVAKELWMLYLFAAVFSFAFGGYGALESPMLAELFGLSSHGLIYGVITVSFTIGAAIGPVLAGHIFDISGSYQLAFLVSAAVGIIGIIPISLLRPTR